MSFGKMIDELIPSDSESEYLYQMGAPSRQMIFLPLENNQMAGDQGSDPSQSGGSCSEEPTISA